MFEIIFIIILLGSFIGMSVMLFLKVPILVILTPEESSSLKKIKERGQGIVKLLSKERITHKVLSKFRVLALKTENKTSDLLSDLRQKSIEKKTKFTEDYWNKLRKKK